jgi:hypothetical protein
VIRDDLQMVFCMTCTVGGEDNYFGQALEIGLKNMNQ